MIKVKDLSGDALSASIFRMMPSIDNGVRCPSNTGGCFAKGALVHAKGGLKPIEEVQVGDFVLSSPEDGSGSQDYKRVLGTGTHENKKIYRIITPGLELNRYVWIAATGNHPFWVEDKGWTRADKVKKNDIFRRADGRLTRVYKQRPIYRTEQDGVGFESHFEDARTSYGTLFDYANNRFVPKGDHDDYVSQEIYASDDPYLGVTVYSLEVEDYHTYYVGKIGIWVHNFNCAEDGI